MSASYVQEEKNDGHRGQPRLFYYSPKFPNDDKPQDITVRVG